jgi:glycosyltransferase involved in cell wall biosynthesis
MNSLSNKFSKLLTITIPTYNRPERLKAQVIRLLPQISDERVSLLILDNGGNVTLDQILPPDRKGDCSQIVIHRNISNIGMCANILRTLEVANTPWVWWLGDDDPVLEDAVDTAMKALAEADEKTLTINTGCGEDNIAISEPVKVYSPRELSQWCQNPWVISNLLHLSSTLVRRELALTLLSISYHNIYSLGPHVAMKFAGLNCGMNVILYPRSLFKSGGYDQTSWSQWKLLLGMATLLELDNLEQEMFRWLRSVYRAWMGHRWPIRILAIILRGDTRKGVYWRNFCFRLAAVSGFWRGLYFSILAHFLCPLLDVQWIRNVVKKVYGSRKDFSSSGY